jgi:hypothetical protein
MPYISASIIVQLMGMAIPYLQKFRKMERVVEIHQPDNKMVNDRGLSCTGTFLS